MVLIINIIVAIILFWLPVKWYSSGKLKVVGHPFEEDKMIGINVNLQFLVFSILTAMIFLGPLSLVKYAYWIIVLLILCFTRLNLRFGGIVNTYLVFIAYCVFSLLFITGDTFSGLMMLIKYTLPLLYLWLAYSAVNDSDDLAYLMKLTTIGMCVYALIIGGFSAKFLGPLYGFLNYGTGGLFISYAPLADYFSSLIVVPIGVYIITKKRIWLLATFWIILSTVLEVVRTGLGGITLAVSLLLLTIYQIKAVPWILTVVFMAVITVFSVPAVREKMFEDEKVEISSISTDNINFNTIKSHGREELWEKNMNMFYYPSPAIGSGIGATSGFLKNQKGLKLLHSDYVQMLCDLGNVGLFLFACFVLWTLFSIISIAWKSTVPLVIKLTGGMALGSCGGTFFSMGFDNVVTYAQQCFVLPFILIGIFLKVYDLYRQGEWR